jgi:hypothetical protein
MEDAASWAFADATFGVEFDNISNVTKLRQVPQCCISWSQHPSKLQIDTQLNEIALARILACD